MSTHTHTHILYIYIGTLILVTDMCDTSDVLIES